MSKPYTILEHKSNGLQAIKLLAEPYSGIIYTYGKVTFNEDVENEKLHIHFEYEILDNADKVIGDMSVFEGYIGFLLEDMIHDGIEQNNLTYTGGVDENRTKDSDESDL